MEASALHAPATLRISLSARFLRLRSDDQLVALFRAGSEDAFGAIHDRYRVRLLAYTRQMLSGSRSDAEDAVQDVFLRAHQALGVSGRPISLRAWLYRVAHNRCIDQLRRPAPTPTDLLDNDAVGGSDPCDEAERREDLRRLITDVRRLPDQQRSALLMRELEGLSYADLAGALDVSVPAVKSLLVRARISLVEAAQARDTSCREIRSELALAHGRGVRGSGRARRHLRDCDGCRDFRGELRTVRRTLALLPAPSGGLLSQLFGLGGAAGGGASASGAAGGGASSLGAAAGAAGTGGGALTAASTAAAVGTKVAAVVVAAAATASGAAAISHQLGVVPVSSPSGASAHTAAAGARAVSHAPAGATAKLGSAHPVATAITTVNGKAVAPSSASSAGSSAAGMAPAGSTSATGGAAGSPTNGSAASPALSGGHTVLGHPGLLDPAQQLLALLGLLPSSSAGGNWTGSAQPNASGQGTSNSGGASGSATRNGSGAGSSPGGSPSGSGAGSSSGHPGSGSGAGSGGAGAGGSSDSGGAGAGGSGS
ncbi:MAG: RNA polymerase sigma factor [Solirubrobacteraceae bacterium]|nr:MAG: hypothetical protein DLM63_10520 [Solirubrobacterales bacterium]